MRSFFCHAFLIVVVGAFSQACKGSESAERTAEIRAFCVQFSEIAAEKSPCNTMAL